MTQLRALFFATRSPNHLLCLDHRSSHSRRVAQSRNHFLCEEGVSIEQKAPQGLGVCRNHVRTIVLGAPHQLRCAALSLTFAAWARRSSVVKAVAVEVRDLHMRRAFVLMTLSKTSSHLRASLRNDRKQLRLQVQHPIQFDAAAVFSKGVFRGIARLVKKPMPPTPKLQLEDGSRITDERQATERWLRFASERHDGQPTSATALLETIAQARSIFAATVRQEWVCPPLPDVAHLFGRVKPGRASVEVRLPRDVFRRFQQELGQLFHPLYIKAIMAIEEPVQWRGGNLVLFPKKGAPNNCCNDHREIAVSSVSVKLLHR